MRPDPTRCLLLIDDEPAQRRLVTAIGARAGWWVRGAPDVDAAAKILTDVDGPPVDAILLDHWLPGPDGTGVIEQIRELASLAPLHTEPALRGIVTAQAALPGVSHVAVFDSAFHRSIPDEASTYAIPLRWREEWGIRRYGFHGLAVASVADRIAARRLVVCHLGGGASVTAVLDGRSVDTTMGFSPLEGVPMATRSGSIDPGAIFYLLREQGLTAAELDHALEHESGLAALGGLDDPLGFAVYTYRVAQAVAGMAIALGGIHTLAFSGGVGENRRDVRDAVAERTRFLGDFTVEVVAAREDAIVARHVRALLVQ